MEREDQSISLTINTNKSYFKMNEEAQKIQKELIKMGFDISMINKVITYFQIKSVEEGIHYLTKIEGKWEHPFIKSEKNENEQKKISISSLPQKYMRKISVIQKFEEENELCEICGEPKTEHRINENDLNDTINNKNNNDIKNREENKNKLKKKEMNKKDAKKNEENKNEENKIEENKNDIKKICY